MKGWLFKERNLIDAKTSVWEVAQHAMVNFMYGLFSGLVITAVSSNQDVLIVLSYYGLKQVEGKILNRNKYTTKLGKNYIFPIPSLVGFMLGYNLSLIFN